MEMDAVRIEEYEKRVLRVMVSEQKRIFTELASMERGHKARLEDIYTNMAFPEVW